MNTKIKNITRVGYLIIVIAVFGVMQSYTSNKIVSNEIIREEHDYQMLSDVQKMFNEALKENDVKEYVYKWIGNKENCRWTIGKCKDNFMNNIENFYDVFYKNMNIKSIRWLVGCFLYYVQIYFLKGRRVNHFWVTDI